MGSWILRSLLLLICGVSGYYLATAFSPSPFVGWWGILGGLLLAGLRPSDGEADEKGPFEESLGKFYWIDPRHHGCQSHFQRPIPQSFQ